jgi:hypothetical protein
MDAFVQPEVTITLQDLVHLKGMADCRVISFHKMAYFFSSSGKKIHSGGG